MHSESIGWRTDLRILEMALNGIILSSQYNHEQKDYIDELKSILQFVENLNIRISSVRLRFE